MTEDTSKNESLVGLYFGLLLGLAVSGGFGYANVEFIRAGQFSEIGGKGGHVIGTITAVNHPLRFWAIIIFTSLGSATFVLYFAGKIIREYRRRRRRAG